MEAKTQIEMLVNRARKNEKRLRSWRKQNQISCYRLYDRDIPEIPLQVDWYKGRLHISDMSRPNEHDDSWLPALSDALAQTFSVDSAHVFTKRRQRQRGKSQYERTARDENRFAVEEGGFHFFVNLSDYIDTGLFLDHRQMRKDFGAQAEGKAVLNLFCYTGAFTVYAAGGGALATTSVDLSSTYLDWAEQNLRLNQLANERHRFVRSGVMEFLRGQGDERYDLAIVDPPTFSNSKSTSQNFEVGRDHGSLLRAVGRRMADDGVIYFSTNSRKFKLDADLSASFEVLDISKQTAARDFHRNPHYCFRLAAR